MTRRIIGIVGGMGPEATADLFTKIIRNTSAQRDQDHLRIIIDNNPAIPDRTAAILTEGESPVDELQKTAQNLVRAGAQVLVMPCNTAHYFYDQIAVDSTVTFLHMMSEVSSFIKRSYPHVSSVGVLATSGTIQSQLYRSALEAQGLVEVIPAREVQDLVMKAIFSEHGIKAGYYEEPRRLLSNAVEHLAQEGAEVVIMGCTEIPLALSQKDSSVPLVDATTVLAIAAIKHALLDNADASEKE